MATAVKDPYVGTLVGGRYEVRSRIASGGMGTVYLAHDNRLARDVALKVMHAHLASDATFVARFTREARAAAGLSHPGIVAVFDQGADEDAVYLAMEHVPGRTLRDVLRTKGALRLRESLDVAEEILAALTAAHRAALVHRDIKPENILIASDGRLRLVDFGLARAASADGSATSTLIGTVGYLAPELLRGGVADARADVYAVGVVLVELLTGRPPFTGSVPAQVAFRHVHEDVPAPSTLRSGLPDAVDDLVRWATARDVDRRPVDAEEFAAAVRRVRSVLSEEDLDAAPRLLAPVPAEADPAGVGHTLAQPVRHGSDAHVDDHPGDAHDAASAGTPRPTLVAPRTPSEPSVPRVARGRSAHPTRRRPRRMLAVLVVLALVGAGLAWSLLAGPLHTAVVPRVTDESAADATTALAYRHLDHVRIVHSPSATVDAGRVSASRPAAGTRVRTTSRVTLTVSTGPRVRSVPALSGTLAQARAALHDVGLRTGTVSRAYSETVPSGSVISQKTASGTQVRPGSAIDLTVSKGRQPIDVPSLIGQSQDDATAALSDLGLAVGAVTTQPSTGIAAGLVMDQTPSSGTLFARDHVDLVISSGPPTVTVPSVVGENVDQAVADLTKAGLQASVNKVFNAPMGIVRQQDPADGQVASGSTVTLTVF